MSEFILHRFDTALNLPQLQGVHHRHERRRTEQRHGHTTRNYDWNSL
ncbi:hypothetical protein [Saccharomonospora viridis]|nr:hypothetical protein [Saccharomonospora viridis]